MRSRPLTALAVTGLLAVPIAAAPAVVPPSAEASRPDRLERAIAREVNNQRRASGVRALRSSTSLRRVARRHSSSQLRSGRISHDRFNRRMARFARGGGAAGETVGFLSSGIRDRARTIVRLWMQSPSHRRQLLDGRYRHVGVGRRTGRLAGSRGVVVTADFAARTR